MVGLTNTQVSLASGLWSRHLASICWPKERPLVALASPPGLWPRRPASGGPGLTSRPLASLPGLWPHLPAPADPSLTSRPLLALASGPMKGHRFWRGRNKPHEPVLYSVLTTGQEQPVFVDPDLARQPDPASPPVTIISSLPDIRPLYSIIPKWPYNPTTGKAKYKGLC